MNITAKEIIDFWYSERIKNRWFDSTPELDKEILDKYQSVWEQAVAGEFYDWHKDAYGCLALVIILDQFPLNMFRGQAKSFASERQAVEVAWHAVKYNFDSHIDRDKLAFLYMPFMHSEHLSEQDLAVKLYREANLDANLKFAEHHRNIIRKFGRFPHRNIILGRESTEAELQYLASDGAFKG